MVDVSLNGAEMVEVAKCLMLDHLPGTSTEAIRRNRILEKMGASSPRVAAMNRRRLRDLRRKYREQEYFMGFVTGD